MKKVSTGTDSVPSILGLPYWIKKYNKQLEKKDKPGLHPDYTKKKFDTHQSGMFFNDAMLSQSTKPKEVADVFPFIWLLNMMSHYRDLLVSGKRQQINFVFAHTKNNFCALHMYFLGTDGPFGNLFYDNLETLPFKFLAGPLRSISFQPNTWDCGLCWCLFIYDTMLAFQHRACMVSPSGKEDAVHFLGHYIHSKAFMDGQRSMDLEKTPWRNISVNCGDLKCFKLLSVCDGVIYPPATVI